MRFLGFELDKTLSKSKCCTYWQDCRNATNGLWIWWKVELHHGTVPSYWFIWALGKRTLPKKLRCRPLKVGHPSPKRKGLIFQPSNFQLLFAVIFFRKSRVAFGRPSPPSNFRGHYIPNPNNALCFGQIPQIYHTCWQEVSSPRIRLQFSRINGATPKRWI